MKPNEVILTESVLLPKWEKRDTIFSFNCAGFMLLVSRHKVAEFFSSSSIWRSRRMPSSGMPCGASG
ncbi:hypothetical protein D3C81_2302230 [compost metagenome]